MLGMMGEELATEGVWRFCMVTIGKKEKGKKDERITFFFLRLHVLHAVYLI